MVHPPLLDRDQERHALADSLGRTAAGRGGLVLVEAPAGAGKSALLAAAAAEAQNAGLRVLSARCNELERDFGFGAVGQLFESALANAPAPQRERLLAGPAAAAGRAITGPESTGANAPGDDGARLHGLYWLARAMAAEEPLALVVDDAHWADPSSLRAFSYLAGRITETPILLLLALRLEEPGAPADLMDALVAEPGAQRIQLAPLGPAAVARLVRRRLPDAGGDVCEAFTTVTGGNPLYLEELLRTVTVDGTSAAPDAAAIHAASVPSLGDRLARRIARGSEDAPLLAAAMSVLGDGGSLEMAAALSGLSREVAGQVAHRLRRIEVLAEEDPFSFVHPLVRLSVYHAIPATDRNDYHRAAAGLLTESGAPAESVASQLGRVPPAGSTAVATALATAAQASLARGAPDEAVHWYRRALGEEARRPPAADLLADLGTAEARTRDPSAIPDLEQALELTTEPQPRTRIAVTLADAHLLAGRWDRAIEVLESVRATSGDDALPAAMRVFVSAYAPELLADLDRDRSALTRLTRGDGWGTRALAAVLAAVAAHRGEAGEARRLADRAREEGGLLSGPVDAPWTVAHLLIALTEIDDYPAALAEANATSTAARRDGSLSLAMTALDHRAWIHCRAGDLVAGEADLRTGMELAAAAESPTAAASQAFYCQDALLERPGLEDVAQRVEAMQLPPELAATWIGAALLAARGRLRQARRESESAVADLRASHEIHLTLRMGPAVSPSASGLALALPHDQGEEAMALVEGELELARGSGLPRPQGVALRATGILEGGTAGVELLRESDALLERSGARLEHARSQVELGAALRRGGHRNEARQVLASGFGLAEACGAVRLAERSREELAAAGGRAPGGVATGVAALTASELRVARLAAGGVSNQQIAQELWVGLKTVETHLSHAYAKLGLSGHGSRTRLAEALGFGD